MPEPKSQEEVDDRLRDYMPIKFGSPLFSKLNKRYWEKEHVRDKPLVIAIHDYHQIGSMVWSRIALIEYLYAKRIKLETNENGKKRIVREDIHFHQYEDKKIPSGFFKIPEAKNISAVLFANSATISKFNRMGKIAGFGSQNFKIFRGGSLLNPDPEASDAIPFFVDIEDPSYAETWSESVVMFHNPHALHPIKPELFPSITHIKIDGDHYQEITRPYDVLSSRTMVIETTD